MLNWWRKRQLQRGSGWRLVQTMDGCFRVERLKYDRTGGSSWWDACYTYPPDQKDEAIAFVQKKQEAYIQSKLAEAGRKIERVIL